MKKTVKIISTLLLVITIISTLSSIALAADLGISVGKVSTTEINSIGSTVLGIVQAVGIVVAVVMLMVLGIKYMLGSAEDKASYKSSMIPYLIGALLIFAAVAIVSAIKAFSSNFSSTVS